MATPTPEEIQMAFDPIGFASGMRRSRDAAVALHRVWTLHDATCEPLDWSELD